jgi:general secretion pathway protein G
VQTSLTFLLIFGIFAVLIYLMVVPKIGDGHLSRIVAAQTDIRAGIKTALDHYKMDTGYFPKNLNDMLQQPSGTTNWHGPYFNPSEVPLDPWGDKYIYEFPGKHNPGSYDLMSLGPDGKKGTDDDIGNWTTQ